MVTGGTGWPRSSIQLLTERGQFPMESFDDGAVRRQRCPCCKTASGTCAVASKCSSWCSVRQPEQGAQQKKPGHLRRQTTLPRISLSSQTPWLKKQIDDVNLCKTLG